MLSKGKRHFAIWHTKPIPTKLVLVQDFLAILGTEGMLRCASWLACRTVSSFVMVQAVIPHMGALNQEVVKRNCRHECWTITKFPTASVLAIVGS